MKNILSTHPTEEALNQDEPAEFATAVRNLGLTQVRAWVPDKADGARSAGAKRTRRSRENAQRQGVKQLSVTLPTELHEPIKVMAARIRAGEPAALVWTDLVTTQNPMPTPTNLPPAPVKIPVWRRWLLRWLLPTDLRNLIG